MAPNSFYYEPLPSISSPKGLIRERKSGKLLAWQTWSASCEDITAILGLKTRVTKSLEVRELDCCCIVGVVERDRVEPEFEFERLRDSIGFKLCSTILPFFCELSDYLMMTIVVIWQISALHGISISDLAFKKCPKVFVST